MTARNVVVIGTQWGDEGKGKIVDWLTDRAQGVVRFQGGHNAGHTLVIGGKTVLHLILPASCATASTASSVTASWCRRRRWSPRWTSSRPRGAQRGGAPFDQRGLPAHPPLSRRPRPCARGRQGRAKDRHHGPRHRPSLRGQGGAARDPSTGLFEPARFARSCASCSTSTTSCWSTTTSSQSSIGEDRTKPLRSRRASRR